VSYPPAHGGTILNLPKVGGLKSQLSKYPEFLEPLKKSIFRAHKKRDDHKINRHARTIFNRHHLVVIDFIKINRHARRGVLALCLCFFSVIRSAARTQGGRLSFIFRGLKKRSAARTQGGRK